LYCTKRKIKTPLRLAHTLIRLLATRVVIGKYPGMNNTESVADLLSFWFGDPAETQPQLLAKLQRWYQGGPELDQEIRERYGALVEAAVNGQLDSWRSSVSGRLALLVLLDQLTRNIYRGTARAYSGDPPALALALDTIANGIHRSYSLEERLFVIMPLVHAENVEMLARAAQLSDEMVKEAPAELRETWSFGAQRVRKYLRIIERFGRYPGRNAALGRRSTAAELAHLAEEAGHGSPLAALSTAAQAART